MRNLLPFIRFPYASLVTDLCGAASIAAVAAPVRDRKIAMSKWQKRRVPPICERLLGFSIPQAGQVLILSYEGTHLLSLANEITVTTDDRFVEYDIYDPDSGVAHYQEKSYQILGLHGGNPILETPVGGHLILDEEPKTLSVVSNSQTDFSMKYNNFSGDWAAATFSDDGKYVVLGCPYDFDFVVLEREGPL